MTSASAASGDRWDRPGLLLLAGIVIVAAIVATPVILREGTRDWAAYEQAAERVADGKPLYVWDLATPDDEYYLYPPGMAAAWSIVGSPGLLLVIKVASLLSVGVLAPLVVADQRRRWLAAALIAAGALIWPPDIHDIVLGNVMALYVGAVAISVARRGWLGAIPIGIVLALAAKPAAIPFLIWLVLVRPRDAVRTVVVALAASVVAALIVGPGSYVDYVRALPQMTALATSFTGNLGLVTLSPTVALIGMVVAWVLAVGAALRLENQRSAVVAIAAMLLAQPTIGFNYAGLLYPALVLLWGRDRLIGSIAFVASSLVVLVQPVAAATVTIALAAVSAWRSPGTASHE